MDQVDDGLLFCRVFLVGCVPKLDSKLIVTVQGPSRLKQKRNLVMATHGLLHLDLNLRVANFWSKYYNHTLTCYLLQLISNLKICNQRRCPKGRSFKSSSGPPLQENRRSQREGKAEYFRRDHLLLDYLQVYGQ